MFLLAPWLASGCGKVTPPAVSGAQACADFAAARCEKRAGCSAGTGVTRAYGDMATCLAREQLGCTQALAAPDIGNSPPLIEECVTALAGMSCSDFFDNQLTPACARHGGRPLGSTCGFSAQCASGFCSESRGTVCGQCALEPTPGTACASATCGHGQLCVATPAICATVLAAGASCDAADPCESGFNCVTGSDAAATSTCQLSAVTAGASCGGGTPGCSGVFGLYCAGSAGARACAAVTYVGDGMPCGPLADGSRAECTAGTCYSPTGPTTSGQTGVCGAAAADGAACDTTLGPPCLLPARCVRTEGGTAGVCTVPDGVACG